MRKSYTLLIFFLLSLFAQPRLLAQDIHFSQFYASPLTLSPAMTGMTEGSYRVTGIYRNQWRSVSTPFQTYGASFDIKLLEGKLKKDVFAVGAVFTGDKSGDGDLGIMLLINGRMGRRGIL